MSDELQLGGVVLCGGDSRRMGRPKAWLRLGSDTLLHHVVDAVRQATEPVVVAARAGQALPPLPEYVEVVHDGTDNGGPLVGLLAALDRIASKCDAVFVCGCDQPFVRPAFIRRLGELLAGHDAVVPSHDGRIHPITAVYHCSVHRTLADMVAERRWRASALARHCASLFPTLEAFRDVDPTLASLVNINDPEDYRELQRALDR